jgi:hypothetical protein
MYENASGRLAGMSEFQRRHRFVFLFAGLLLLLLIAPFLEKTRASRETLSLITTFILFSGIYSGLKESRWLFGGLILLGGVNILTTWWEYASWSLAGALVHYVGLILFFLIMTVVILREVARETSINPNVIYGAVTVYLLIAYIWGLIFAIVFLLEPMSFRNMAVPLNAGFSVVPFWYLSFFTITTLGYTDIAPASDLTKSLAVIEAVVGQLYLILQVSLLVGLRVSVVAARHHDKILDKK